MKFQVYKKGKLVKDFTLCGAHMFGTDGVGIRRARIGFRNGTVECKRSNLETAGLALLWHVEGFGKVLLSTTCLPERKRPYILNVEIARGKLMQIVNKREDWSFFDGLGPLSELANKTQALFIKALQNISQPALASQLADKALQNAMMLSEKLAMVQADDSFKARCEGHGFGKATLGCKLDMKQTGNAHYLERMFELFGFVTIPIHWSRIERVRGQYDFSQIDACIEILNKRRVVIGAGPLLRFSKEYLPKWLIGSKMSFEKIRELCYQFITRIVKRYFGAIRVWHAISGLNVFNYFGFSFEQILEMTRAANLAVKASSDRAFKVIEISNPWGEYYSVVPGSIPPLVYMDMVVQSGINFDAFGLQMRFGRNQSGMHIRDMMQISAILDYFGPISKPLYVTDVEIPSENGKGNSNPEFAGSWHRDWSEKTQKEWMEHFYRIALSKPYVDTITYGNLADRSDSIVHSSGLLTGRIEPKKSFVGLKKLHGAMFEK